jgi:hypothetical protein
MERTSMKISSAPSDRLLRMTQLLWKFDRAPANDERPGSCVEGVSRSCNRHVDCDEADQDTLLGHGRLADHCHDEYCEDCYGY